IRAPLVTGVQTCALPIWPWTLPTHSLYRMNIVNYLLRNYAPFDRRMRAVAKLQADVPRFLKDLRATLDRRLADTFYEVGEMAARSEERRVGKEGGGGVRR